MNVQQHPRASCGECHRKAEHSDSAYSDRSTRSSTQSRCTSTGLERPHKPQTEAYLGAEVRPDVRAVAEGLVLGATAGAPPVVLALFNSDGNGSSVSANDLMRVFDLDGGHVQQWKSSRVGPAWWREALDCLSVV